MLILILGLIFGIVLLILVGRSVKKNSRERLDQDHRDHQDPAAVCDSIICNRVYYRDHQDLDGVKDP